MNTQLKVIRVTQSEKILLVIALKMAIRACMLDAKTDESADKLVQIFTRLKERIESQK